MKVVLMKNWFAPDMRTYSGDGRHPVEVPEKFKDVLPKTAKIVGDSYVIPKEPVTQAHLMEATVAMAQAEAERANRATAEEDKRLAELRENARKFEEEKAAAEEKARKEAEYQRLVDAEKAEAEKKQKKVK